MEDTDTNKMSLNFVPKDPVNNKSALVQVKSWCFRGTKPLPKLVITQFIDSLDVLNRHFSGLVKDCNNSSALAMELLQSYAQPSIYISMDISSSPLLFSSSSSSSSYMYHHHHHGHQASMCEMDVYISLGISPSSLSSLSITITITITIISFPAHKVGFRGSFHQCFFHLNLNLMEIYFCSHVNSSKITAMKFCTWHDSFAVVACAKSCIDIVAKNMITLNQNFHWIRITVGKLLVKWATNVENYDISQYISFIFI